MRALSSELDGNAEQSRFGIASCTQSSSAPGLPTLQESASVEFADFGLRSLAESCRQGETVAGAATGQEAFDTDDNESRPFKAGSATFSVSANAASSHVPRPPPETVSHVISPPPTPPCAGLPELSELRSASKNRVASVETDNAVSMAHSKTPAMVSQESSPKALTPFSSDFGVANISPLQSTSNSVGDALAETSSRPDLKSSSSRKPRKKDRRKIVDAVASPPSPEPL